MMIKFYKEIWKDINNYDGLYQISNYGRVKSLATRFKIDKVLKSKQTKIKYLSVVLCKDKHQNRKYIHRLVAQAFIPNPDNLPQVNHKDGDKTNNHYKNLEWCTPHENMLHAYKNNLKGNGEKMFNAKLNNINVIEIREKYNTKQYTQQQLANNYNVSRQLVGMVIRGEIWKHLL